MQATIHFFRNGQEIKDSLANGLDYVGPCGVTGIIRGFACRRAVLVADPRLPGRRFYVGPEDFGGPVMVQVVCGERVTRFALATHEQVREARGEVRRSIVYQPRDGRGTDSRHEPIDQHPAAVPGGLAAAVRPADVPAPYHRWPAPEGSLWRAWQRDLRDSRRRAMAR